ncbi:MAG: GTP 3',8-cyclase MoaA, partial [Oscillospiraceae bacterium]|nr:GTP 3',8-cyclase MoaA [Oscillospiraceae bacterium]
TCLQFEAGVHIADCLRSGKSDKELLDVLLQGIAQKPKSHKFDQKDNLEKREYRNMSQIGG